LRPRRRHTRQLDTCLRTEKRPGIRGRSRIGAPQGANPWWAVLGPTEKAVAFLQPTEGMARRSPGQPRRGLSSSI